MRALAGIVVIVALAVGLTLAARFNTGYMLLVLPSHRIELSLNLLLALLAMGFAGGYSLVRLVSTLLRLPRQAREYRAGRSREKARAQLLEALHEYFAGRYGRAEKAAAAALEQGEQPALSAVLAARAAHELHAGERRDAYLARAAAAAGDDPARVITEAELLLDQNRHQEALAVLQRLPRRHTAALRLEWKAQQQARNWEQVLPLTEELRRRNVFDATQAEQVRRHALTENLKRKALDTHALDDSWGAIPAAERANRRVAAAAARCYIALGDGERARRIIEAAVEESWDSELAGLYAECEGGDVVKRIERAEGWLATHPRDAVLLYALGRLCGQQQLWGKAQSYLEASIAVEPTYTAHFELARLQEQLGNAEVARRHYRAGLNLALAQLQAATGGRRRTPL